MCPGTAEPIVTLDLEGERCNEEAARLLPWYVNGRLSAADSDRVSSHLQHCAICRNDVAQEAAVHALIKTEGRIEYAPQAGLAKTLSRIDELARDAPVDAARADARPVAPMDRARRRTRTLQWLTAAVLVQAVALGWLGVSLRHAPQASATSRYQTLSTDTPRVSGAHIRVVFASTMTLAELSALLAADHLLIVNGPTSAGAYTLASTDPRADAAPLGPMVDKLRSDSRVLFAEPAINDAAPMP
jgi:anti-sigma factor RsiW